MHIFSSLDPVCILIILKGLTYFHMVKPGTRMILDMPYDLYDTFLFFFICHDRNVFFKSLSVMLVDILTVSRLSAGQSVVLYNKEQSMLS